MSTPSEPRRTPLHDLHLELDARMVEFAGWAMPLTFAGAVEEHLHTRAHASLFDVSHMQVCDVVGDDAATAFERLTPSRVVDLPPGQGRYLVLTNASGGIVDDTIATRTPDGLRLVLNASRAEVDVAHLRQHLGDRVVPRPELALVALQGPAAATAMAAVGADVDGIPFLGSRATSLLGGQVVVSRSGYTGEDGFEVVAPRDDLPAIARALLRAPDVLPAGLAARDSLRIEAGLCLYGQDIDETTTPVEAGLTWTIPQDRRDGGDYLGATTITAQLSVGAPRRLVGLRPEGRRPVRHGNPLLDGDGEVVGVVTSGVWGATVAGPVAFGLVSDEVRAPGTRLVADVRGREVACVVAPRPFVAPARLSSRSQ